MSIAETYKSEFKIYGFDEDLKRSEKTESDLTKSGYRFTAFNSRGLFLESLKGDELPHVIMLYYQPLNLKFRELLQQIRQASDEIEIVLLSTKDFWPGVSHLIDAGLVTDFWSYPMADPQELKLRLNHLIEKTIYQYIAEQRGEETEKIIHRLSAIENGEFTRAGVTSDTSDVVQLLSPDKGQSESRIVEDLFNNLKAQFSASEFVFFKNYPARDQLLVTRTSFSKENYFRGQSIPFSQERLLSQRGDAFQSLREIIEQTFSVKDFVMQPVELADNFFGVIMAINFEDSAYLQRTSRYLAMTLRNLHLESAGNKIEIDKDIEVGISSSQFPLVLSSEISRARRLKKPVSLLISYIEYIGDDEREKQKAFDMIKGHLRSYDFITQLKSGEWAIVLPHCSYEDAAIKAETIRRQLVAQGLKSQNAPLRLCFGVSEFPTLSVDSDSLIEDAKKACSQVMVSGKNKVCLYAREGGFEPEFQVGAQTL